MPIYNVKVWYTTFLRSEVEAKDEEEALYLAITQEFTEEHECVLVENLEAMEFNNEVELSDNQYTDQQELQDREKTL